jgi:hypothetical protein
MFSRPIFIAEKDPEYCDPCQQLAEPKLTTALYKVMKKGYCAEHKAEAEAAMKRVGTASAGKKEANYGYVVGKRKRESQKIHSDKTLGQFGKVPITGSGFNQRQNRIFLKRKSEENQD